MLSKYPQNIITDNNNNEIKRFDAPTFEVALKCYQLLNFRIKCTISSNEWNERDYRLSQALLLSSKAVLDCSRHTTKNELLEKKIDISTAYEKTANIAQMLDLRNMDSKTFEEINYRNNMHNTKNGNITFSQTTTPIHSKHIVPDTFWSESYLLRHEGKRALKTSEEFLAKIQDIII